MLSIQVPLAMKETLMAENEKILIFPRHDNPFKVLDLDGIVSLDIYRDAEYKKILEQKTSQNYDPILKLSCEVDQISTKYLYNIQLDYWSKCLNSWGPREMCEKYDIEGSTEMILYHILPFQYDLNDLNSYYE